MPSIFYNSNLLVDYSFIYYFGNHLPWIVFILSSNLKHCSIFKHIAIAFDNIMCYPYSHNNLINNSVNFLFKSWKGGSYNVSNSFYLYVSRVS